MAAAPYIVTRGVVLRETETKEADKILTLLTADRGRLSVIARGVRRIARTLPIPTKKRRIPCAFERIPLPASSGPAVDATQEQE